MNVLFHFLEKSKSDPLIVEPEGIALVKDVLYILKKVCQMSKEQKQNAETNETESKEEEALAEINELTEGNAEGKANTNATASKANPATGPGRGRRKRELTMPEAVS